MKNKTFKKSLSVFLAVLMLMSCWVWVPGEHNHVSAVASNVRGVPAIRGSHYAGTTAAYGTPVFDGSLDRWFKFHNKGSDYVKISYPSEIYLDKSETLQSAGYFFNVDWHFGQSTDYRIFIGANAFGHNSQWSEYAKSHTMTKIFSDYGFDASVPSGSAGNVYNTSTGGTDYDLRVVGFGHVSQGEDGFNYNGIRHDKYILFRSNNSSDPNKATVYLMGTPTTDSNYLGKRSEYNTSGDSYASYGWQQNYDSGGWFSSAGWKENNNSMFKQKSYDQANDDCSSYYEGQYAEMQWFVTLYDKSDLNTAVTTADARLAETNKWTGASLQNLKSVLNSYRDVLTTRATNQSAIDTAKNKINEAINALELRDFTVTFNTLGGNAISAYTFKYDQELGYYGYYLPIPTKNGYTFDGWYADNNGNGQRDSSEEVTYASGELLDYLKVYPITQDWIIYPHWIPNKYEILFDNLIDFKKWDTTAASHGTITNITDNGFTLSYNNDGAGEATSTSPYFPVEAGKSYRVDADYIGDAWDVYIFFYDDNTQSGLGIDFEDGPNRRYSSGSAWEPVFTAPAGATRAVIRLDANGTDNSVRFENIRVYEEGKVVDGLTSYPLGNNVTYDAQYGSLPTPNRENYTFAGWVDKDGNAVSPTDIVKITKNETLYSTWTANNFTVTFEKADGSTTSAQYAYGTPATDIAKPANTADDYDTDKHYAYSWPTVNNVTGDVTYTEIKTGTAHSYTTHTDKDDTYHTDKCSCGYSKDVTHSYDSGVVTKEATCTATGVKTYTCSVCNGTKTETIAKKAHNLTKTEAKAATCLAEGNTAYWTCSVCKKLFSDANATTETTADAVKAAKLQHSYTGAIKSDGNGKDATHSFKCVNGCDNYGAATNHTWNDGKVTTSATCLTGGVKTYTCTAENCGATYTENIDANGHNFGNVTEANAATCLAAGNEAYKQCTVCNLYFAENAEKNATDGKTDTTSFVITQLDHSYTGAIKSDGNGKDATHSFKCVNGCDNYGAATNHTWNDGEVTTSATCLTGGVKTYTCKAENCGATYTENIDANGHNFGDVTEANAATCLAAGNEAYKSCTSCGKFFAENAGADSADGKDKAEDFTLAIVDDAHDWNEGKITTEPTCTEKGIKTYTCKHNSAHTREEDVSALDHIDADGNGYCDRENCKELICDHKGQDTKVTDKKDVTCTEDGYTGDTRCAKCNVITEHGSVIPKLGHKDEDKNHACDNGCDAYQGEHVDTDTDHKCDYGCSVAIGTCEDKDKDHDCDYGCGADFGEHEDENTDHKCDYGCKVAIGTHADSAEDKDHVCDYGCGETLEECVDTDKDHACDNGCEKYFGKHEDTDKDHDCDYGCSETIGTHADSAEDKDHVCDYGCGETLEECVDTDKDHACDNGCEKYFGKHEDTDTDHKCDYGCSESIGTCEDKDLDHDCDYGCDKVYGKHEDTDTDHKCDYGCSESIGTCEDKDKDHDCDYGCGADFGKHEDENTDHKCDYGCSETIGAHTDSDVDDNHVCDYGCGAVLEACVDTYPIDGKCDVCGVDICKHNDYIHYERVEATCKATGNVEYWHCNTCGRNYSDADCKNLLSEIVIPVNPNAHKAEADYTVMQKATCEADGYKAILCEYCDAELSKETIAKRAHTYKDNGVQTAATCKAEGVMNTICSNTETDTHAACTHESTRVIPIDPNAHTGTADVIKNKKPATCKEEGYTGDTYWSCCDTLESKGQTIEALPHTEATRKENVVYPSCGNNGSYDVVTYCSVCSKVISRVTMTDPATGEHNFATVKEKVDATCNTEGYIIRVCGCGAEEKEIIPANDSVHAWETDENGAEKWIISKEPTCVSKGEKICYCTASKGHYKVEYIEPTGHNYEAAENGVVAPSCMNQGYTKYICSKENCGSVEHRDFVAALGHDLVSVVTAPTCEERGYTENYCNRCTYTYTDSYTEATGHADKNGDGKCDGCKENNVSVCSCACHSTNWFIKLIYKIVRFIWKLLKVNADCRCGAIHY